MPDESSDNTEITDNTKPDQPNDTPKTDEAASKSKTDAPGAKPAVQVKANDPMQPD